MQKSLYIVQDSSFLISLINYSDVNHKIAWDIFSKMISHNKIILIISSIVHFEVLYSLLKSGIKYNLGIKKFNEIRMLENVLNVNYSEIESNKFLKNFSAHISSTRNLPSSSDFLVASAWALFKNSLVLTFDKKMAQKLKPTKINIFDLNNSNEVNQLQNLF